MAASRPATKAYNEVKNLKFLALLTSLFLFFSPAALLSAEEVETEETPIVEEVEEEREEVVPGFTEEELDAIISERFADLVDDALTLTISAWDSFIAVLGVSSLGGLVVLVHWMLKRFGLYNGLLNSNSAAIKTLTGEVFAERRDLDEVRKTFMALLTMLNVDPRVKTTLIDRLASGGTVEEFAKAAKELDVEFDNKEIEEVASLLEQISK